MTVGRQIRIIIAALLCIGSPCHAAWSQETRAQPLAGLISDLLGEASILSPGEQSAKKASRFDAIVPGATLEVGENARVVIVLAGGRRFELGAKARATITAAELASTSGPISELSRLPSLPKLAALDDSRPQGPPGGVRVRSDVVSGLSPSHAVLSMEPTTLRFDPVKGASRYSVEVEDEAGRRVVGGETSAPEFVVAPGVLQPGATYYWRVQTVDKVGAAARGSSRFTTLSTEQMQSRDALRRTLSSQGGADSLAFLAEVDRRLGLVQEALNGFRAALREKPDDPAIQRAIRALEATEKPSGR
jgi:hypothetical protein